jgi:hypothetical protein
MQQVLLAEGDFDAGWREYRFRYRLARTAMLARHVQKPRWDGRPIPGQTLLLHDEQGYGDTFQFLQLVALARARSGARVILEVKQPCHALARRGGLADEVIAAGSAPPAFDLHCELMSLPLVLGLRLADLPVRTAYLRADPDRLAFWRARLADLPRPRVGLVASIACIAWPRCGPTARKPTTTSAIPASGWATIRKPWRITAARWNSTRTTLKP